MAFKVPAGIDVISKLLKTMMIDFDKYIEQYCKHRSCVIVDRDSWNTPVPAILKTAGSTMAPDL